MSLNHAALTEGRAFNGSEGGQSEGGHHTVRGEAHDKSAGGGRGAGLGGEGNEWLNNVVIDGDQFQDCQRAGRWMAHYTPTPPAHT